MTQIAPLCEVQTIFLHPGLIHFAAAVFLNLLLMAGEFIGNLSVHGFAPKNKTAARLERLRLQS